MALCAAFAATGVRAENDAIVQQANALRQAGQPAQAYELLEPQEVRRAGDPDFDLAFGIAANAINQFSRAILALERVLVVDPDNVPARAELGRALYAVGDTRAARALLSQSQLQGVPAVAGETIDQLLYAIDRVEAAGQSSYKGYVEFGLGHDDNANSGPAERNFAVPALGGSIVSLNPTGVKTSAEFWTLGGGLSGRYVLDPRWSLVGNASGAARGYGGSADKFDVLYVDANGGISYRVERHELTLVAQVGIYDIDGERVRNLTGVVGEWTYRIDGFRQVGTYLQYGRLSYPQQHIADADRTVFGLTYANLFRNGMLAYGGIYTGEEAEREAGVPHLGHKLVGARGGLQYPLGPNFAVFGTLGYEERRFGGVDPLFAVSRRDRQTNASLGVSWVPAQYWRVTPQVARTQNRSTVDLAEYDKTVVSVVVRRDF